MAETVPLLRNNQNNQNNFDSIEQIAQKVANLSRILKQLENNVNSLSNPRVALSQTKDKIRQEIESAKQLILNINAYFREAPTPNDDRTKIVYQRLRVQFDECRNSFQKSAETVLRLESQSISQENFTPNISVENIGRPGSMQIETETLPFQSSQFNVEESSDIDQHILSEQTQGWQEISSEMSALGELMQDFKVTLSEQGEVLKKTDENTSNAEAAISDAIDELKTAEEYANSARRRTVCITFIVIIVILVIAGIITVSILVN
eukprot:TRINITY_DN2354_c4_g1_i1.p1 TRINITY_DN2354_c4_g1~~TRINITY_DN2354_c4_g1_i1.p1  ORF type:complete len:264 (-),score=120.97 TRINITY_DN2354_c4_g1_i1:187-978(-)